MIVLLVVQLLKFKFRMLQLFQSDTFKVLTYFSNFDVGGGITIDNHRHVLMAYPPNIMGAYIHSKVGSGSYND